LPNAYVVVGFDGRTHKLVITNSDPHNQIRLLPVGNDSESSPLGERPFYILSGLLVRVRIVQGFTGVWFDGNDDSFGVQNIVRNRRLLLFGKCGTGDQKDKRE
jgi:hypothetical protein